MRLLVLLAVPVLALALAGCSGAACKGFCELECKKVIKCDGVNLTGAKYDACVNSCVDAVRAAGAQSDKDCECCTPTTGNACDGGQKTCESEPVSVWAKGYPCQ